MQYNAAPMHAIYKFEIAQKVPLVGEISFTDLASQCGLYEPDLRRIVRFAIVYHRAFLEPRKGYVAHSAASRQLVEDPDVRDGIGLMFDDFYQSFARVSQPSVYLLWPIYPLTELLPPADRRCHANISGPRT